MVLAENRCEENGLTAGIVAIINVEVKRTEENQLKEMRDLIELRQGGQLPDQELLRSVRQMIKKGGFSPNGRNKPASEYLIKTAKDNAFPFINNAADLTNYFSLLWGLPISLLDLDSLSWAIDISLGLPGENYVFNKSGQILDLNGLITIRSKDNKPLGSPIKDSMDGKITLNTKNMAGIIYAPSHKIDKITIESFCRDFAGKARLFLNASETASFIL